MIFLIICFAPPPLQTDSQPCIRIGGTVACIGGPVAYIGSLQRDCSKLLFLNLVNLGRVVAFRLQFL